MGSFLARLRRRTAVPGTALLVSAVPLAAAGDLPVPPAGRLPLTLEAAREPAQDARLPVRIEGTVRLPGGGPARGALVVSSAGGSVAVGEDGSFALELALEPEALAVELTAVASAPGGTLIARGRVDDLSDGARRHAGTLHLAQSEGCVPDWIPTFGGTDGTNLYVYALAVFDDGSGGGPALYVAGAFTAAGGVSANRIVKWDGETWSALAGGLNDEVYALTVFDDGTGTGPALIAGGRFSSAGGASAKFIAKWDGESWSPLGSGMNGSVLTLAVFDDGAGAGPALHAGGDFSAKVSKWDGASWSTLGGGLSSRVSALAVFDDGSGAGPELYAGGSFTSVGGAPGSYIARWDGGSWGAVGGGMNASVTALTVCDLGSGSGPALYAGGKFTQAGGQPAERVARWDGESWSALGSGGWSEFSTVSALAVFDDGSGAGPVLCAGGDFWLGAGMSAKYVLQWDGASWSSVGHGMGNGVSALAVFDDGSGAGPWLYAGGTFTQAGGQEANYVAKWKGLDWSQPGDLGVGLGGVSQVLALSVFDDGAGGGPALYAGGAFTSADGKQVNNIATWDGKGWTALASGLNGGTVHALTVFDDGSGGGPALYAGGKFVTVGGQTVNRIAKWDGETWSALSSGASNAVLALTVFDDGSGGGPALFAGGPFTSAGGESVNNIAKWDGQSWSSLGQGLDGQVIALAVHDDGSGAGPALYAGGYFDSAGGQSVNYIARWDGQSWSGLSGGVSGPVDALSAFDDGSGAGPALYAGGHFHSAGGQSAEFIARWDGESWGALAGGMNAHVATLTVHDDGSGLALYAGGSFTTAGGESANRIAKWDGQGWAPLGMGVEQPSSSVTAFAVFENPSGSGPALYAGGSFDFSPGGDSFLALWGCPGSSIEAVPGCFGNPAALTPLSSELALGSTFDVTLSSSHLATGLGLLFFGADGTDAAGCGLFVPGWGELLLRLSPMPVQAGSGPLSAGAVGFALPVPDAPSLVGVKVGFHGVVVGLFDPGLPIELSNGLLATVAQ